MNLRFNIPSYSEIRHESRPLAMGLIIVGAALGMYMNFYFGNIGWNNVLMLGSLMLLPNWRNLSSFRLPFVNRTFKAILLFQVICIVYMVIGGLIDISLMTYLLFTIFMVMGIMSQTPSDMSIPKVAFYSWLFGWICIAFCTTTMATGAFFIEYARLHDGSGYQSILIDLTMAGNIYTFIVCCLYYLKSSKTKSNLSILGIIIGLILMVILGKRTPLLISIISICFYLFRFHPISRTVNKKAIGYSLLFLVLIVLLLKISDFGEIFIAVIKRSIDGIFDMIHGTSSTGAAAMERYRLRDWAFTYIENKFTPFNYLFGAGFMTKWLDAPLIQAYLDMGIIGFSVYLYYVIVKPLKLTISRLSRNRIVFWGCALNFYNIFSALNSGVPYIHLRWIPLIVLVLTINSLREGRNRTEIKLCYEP